MAFMYIDENSPVDQEYMSNYIYFDEKEPGVLKRMMHKCVAYIENSRTVKEYELLNDNEVTPIPSA